MFCVEEEVGFLSFFYVLNFYFLFLGECWVGYSGKNNYLKYGEDIKGCIEDSFLICILYSCYCVGK